MTVDFKYHLGQIVYVAGVYTPIECSVIGRCFEETICRNDENRPKHVIQIKYTLSPVVKNGIVSFEANQSDVFDSLCDASAFLLSKLPDDKEQLEEIINQVNENAAA